MTEEKNPTFGVEPGSVAASYSQAEQSAMDEYMKGAGDDSTAAEEDSSDEPTVASTTDDYTDEVEEVSAEDETEASEPEPVKFDPDQWDGKNESLPEDVRPYVENIRKTMERGLHGKFQELASLRKEYESKLESLQSAKTPTPGQNSNDVPPPPPTSDMTYEEQVEAQNKRDEWFMRREVERKFSELPQFQQVNQMAMQQQAADRTNLVRSQPGFTPEVGAAMAQIAESHPAYARLLDTDESALVLFQMAKIAVDNATLRSGTDKAKQVAATEAGAVVKKKASAGQNAISRAGGTRKATAADNFAKWGFADAEKAALEAWEAGRSG